MSQARNERRRNARLARRLEGVQHLIRREMHKTSTGRWEVRLAEPFRIEDVSMICMSMPPFRAEGFWQEQGSDSHLIDGVKVEVRHDITKELADPPFDPPFAIYIQPQLTLLQILREFGMV